MELNHMELKPYQQQVIDDLALFLEHVQVTKNTDDAFHKFWFYHPRTPLTPSLGTDIAPYKNNIPRTPHVCMKVPTAGGKTFIACNALRTIFDAFYPDKTKAVVWLVPSITILDQTLKNLKDTHHPYRRKIKSLFGNSVEVFDKATLLQGSGFNPTSVKEQLSIMVFSFDSLRARNKEDRKVFQENGNLQSFEHLLGLNSEISLGDVIKFLNPVVIVDESHNAEGELSIEMLKGLNPCFILDLTATPRNNSNIISFIDALELKRENMVKLPVIVYNHHDKTGVIDSSLQLQKRLEQQAKSEERNGGKYIRPIVLFQVQPRSGNFNSEEEEKTNVQKLKEKLLELAIPEDQIKIKTANINEIKGVDLLSKDCQVRYIITINALKEGWDCPFAYILASLADKSSAVDVEQILGRVLRQPYVMQHHSKLLNLSYVLTASSKFMDTLANIVKGLNKAGFSDKDYRIADNQTSVENAETPVPNEVPVGVAPPGNLFPIEIEDVTADIDFSQISVSSESDFAGNDALNEIENAAIQQNEEFEKLVSQMDSDNGVLVPSKIQPLIKTYTIKKIFREAVDSIILPQFYLYHPQSDLFGRKEDTLLEKEFLLDGFLLSQCDVNINFDSVDLELYSVDLDPTRRDATPSFVKLDNAEQQFFYENVFLPNNKKDIVKNFTRRVKVLMGKMIPIPDSQITKYLNRIFEGFNDNQFNDFLNKENSYTNKIKQKIHSLADHHAKQKFEEFLMNDKIRIKTSYRFPNSIHPNETAKDFTKSLYEREYKINGFEERVINAIVPMPNISFWTRNVEKKGFCINGFINHYPDFIIRTTGGKTIILETKGDHLDAETKIELGRLWESKAGNDYRYFMVYETREVRGAYTIDSFLPIIQNIN